MNTAAADTAPPVLREEPVPDVTVPRLELRDWATAYGLVAGVTTRQHGFSLGLWSEEPVGPVMGRWRAFRNAFAPGFPTVVLSHQAHGNAVAWHDRVSPGWHILDGFDAHVTTTRGVLLTVTVADCIPVYLGVPGRAVGLVHAGWRGVHREALKAAVSVLAARGNVSVTDIIMHCGVGICGTCYEVGSEVAEQLTGVKEPGPSHVDLRSLLVVAARRLGIERVSVSPWCSAHDRDRFYSHRGSGGTDGRMIAYLGLPIA